MRSFFHLFVFLILKIANLLCTRLFPEMPTRWITVKGKARKGRVENVGRKFLEKRYSDPNPYQGKVLRV